MQEAKFFFSEKLNGVMSSGPAQNGKKRFGVLSVFAMVFEILWASGHPQGCSDPPVESSNAKKVAVISGTLEASHSSSKRGKSVELTEKAFS